MHFFPSIFLRKKSRLWTAKNRSKSVFGREKNVWHDALECFERIWSNFWSIFETFSTGCNTNLKSDCNVKFLVCFYFENERRNFRKFVKSHATFLNLKRPFFQPRFWGTGRTEIIDSWLICHLHPFWVD